jgi:hypothetical protein
MSWSHGREPRTCHSSVAHAGGTRVQDVLWDHLTQVLGPNATLSNRKTNETNIPIRDVSRLLKPANIVQFKDVLAARAHVALVGAAAGGHDAREVALHSCLGLWPGCIPKGSPALHYHHGTQWAGGVRNETFLASFRLRILRALQLWLAVLDDSSLV